VTSFDDQLRDALASSAERVGPLADVLPDVRRRARRIRRRRVTVVAVASSLAVLLFASLPMVLRPGWHGGASAVAPGDAPPLLTADSTGPADGDPPATLLGWTARGDVNRAPASLRVAATARLAKLLGVRPADVKATPLYAGQAQPLGHDWVYVAQGWSTANRTRAAQVVAVRASSTGKNAHAVSGGTVIFRHSDGQHMAAPSGRQSVAATPGAGDPAQITMLSFALDPSKAVTLLLGDPKRVNSFAYSRDGVTFTALATHAAAVVFTRHPTSLDGVVLDMVRAVDATGRNLTPADAHAVRVANTAPQVDDIPAAWSLPDYAAAP
jgi:hypothetical protein